jgi:hypothetical protein
LPTLDTGKRDNCDAPLTIEELTTALQKANAGKSPGLDGLTYEWYRKFWNELGPLLLRVANSSMREGKLPTSMLNGIITLIPKHGDLTLLSSWRPITLLNTDYKLITKCLAGRITSVLPDLITTDQSYCIPNKTIHNNLHLIRDAIDHANMNDLPLAILSLDQASAYDCVEHPYVFHVLKKFGFGNNFIQAIRTVYHNAQGLVKTNGTLTAPIKFERGVRQGDPLSGPLFTLTIEPFLLLCNQKLRDYGLKIPSPMNRTLVTSAYADDITVFITQDEGFPHLLKNFMIYGALSGATLNIQKSQGLFVGQWRNRTDRPLGFQWSEQGGKYLGIYLGNTDDWQQKNWTQLENKTRTILQKWEKVPHATSYLDRKQLINQLVGAQMTHVLTILQPTATFLNTMHKLIVNFIWQGKHWKHPNFIYGRPEDGGIGVHHLPTRINTIRFNFLQNFIGTQQRENTWHLQAHNIRMYDQALDAEAVLKLNLIPARFPKLTPFYASSLEAWRKIRRIVNPNIQSLVELRHVPLHDSTLLTPHITGGTVLFEDAWKNFNLKYIGDLITENGHWKKLKDIDTTDCTPSTTRRLKANLRKAEAFFHHHYHNLSLQNTSSPPSHSYVIKQTNGQLTPLPISKRKAYNQLYGLKVDERVPVNGECHWKFGKQYTTTPS